MKNSDKEILESQLPDFENMDAEAPFENPDIPDLMIVDGVPGYYKENSEFISLEEVRKILKARHYQNKKKGIVVKPPKTNSEVCMTNNFLNNIVEDRKLLTKQDILDIKKSISEMEQGKFKTLKQMKTKYKL